jgi:hypothetical protein
MRILGTEVSNTVIHLCNPTECAASHCLTESTILCLIELLIANDRRETLLLCRYLVHDPGNHWLRSTFVNRAFGAEPQMETRIGCLLSTRRLHPSRVPAFLCPFPGAPLGYALSHIRGYAPFRGFAGLRPNCFRPLYEMRRVKECPLSLCHEISNALPHHANAWYKYAR